MACADAGGGQAAAAAAAGHACAHVRAHGELVVAIRPHNNINDDKTDRGETEEAQRAEQVT